MGGVESRESLRRDSDHSSSSSSDQSSRDSTDAQISNSSWEPSGVEKWESESKSGKVAGGEQERENASGLKSSTPTEMFGVVDYLYST